MRLLLVYMMIACSCFFFVAHTKENKPANDLSLKLEKSNMNRRRIKRFIDVAVSEFAGIITCCKDASFYPSTCSYKAQLSKLANRLAISEELIKPLVKHQQTIDVNLKQIKRFLANLRSRLPSLLKYADVYFKMIPVVVQDFQTTNSFEEIKKMFEKSPEAEIMEGITKAMATVELILLVADPTKISVALTAVFSVVGLVMNIVSQKQENAHLGQQLRGVEDQWRKMEDVLETLVINSGELDQNWQTLEETALKYGRDLSQTYMHLQKLLPETFPRPLPGVVNLWKSQEAYVYIHNLDARYKIRPGLDPAKLFKKIFQLEVNTKQAMAIHQEVEVFLDNLEYDFTQIFHKYLKGTDAAKTLTTNEKVLLLNYLAPAIYEKLHFAELLKRSRYAGLDVDRMSLFKVISNMMPYKKCYGMYPLYLITTGQSHDIFGIDYSESTINYVRRKTIDQDYPIDLLVRRLNRRNSSSAKLWTHNLVIYLLSAIYPKLSSYMGKDLHNTTYRQICSNTNEETLSQSKKMNNNRIADSGFIYPTTKYTGSLVRQNLSLTLRKYEEVYDENFQGCKWRFEAGSNTTSFNDGNGTTGQRHNAWAMAGHDELNVHADVEAGHRKTHRDVTGWANARGGYKVGDIINQDGKAGVSAHVEDNGEYNAQANAGTGLTLGGVVNLDVGSKAESKYIVDQGSIDIGTRVGVNANSDIAGVGLGVSQDSGVGVSGGLNYKDDNLGASVLTPVGSYGAHVGCKTKICFFGCIQITVC
eukprot:GFUD01135891.1.p1 GENE.GFUD01135891.1~~GFUD01135891.1.p1  ORF type:complete len:758 (-),score=144.05 GFUD01135891.1:151-2424(-)